MTNKHTFKRAVYWAYTMYWGEKGFMALFAFVLAALLGPSDFGIVALGMIYITFIQMVLDQGLTSALIQKKDLKTEHLDSVFWMDLVLSIFLVGLSILLSNWWARVNHVPRLAAIICVLSLCIPIEGLAIVQKAVLQKALDFKSLSIRSNLSVIFGGAAGLFMAFRGYGVWALVGQRLTEDLTALLLLWGISDYRPGLRFSFHALRELLGFSTASFVSRLGTFVYQYSDSLLMGIFFGPLALGLFRLADRLVGLVHDGVTNALQVVAYPQFSRVQDNPQELKESVLACIRISAIFTLPALACLALSSQDIMATLGAKWLPATDTLKVLCVAGMTLTFTKFTGSLLNAKARPRLVAALTWGFNAVAIALLCTAGPFLKDMPVTRQILGMAGVRFINVACIFAPVYVIILLRACGIRLRELLANSASAICTAALVALALWALGRVPWVDGLRPALALTLDGFVGIAVASVTLLLIDAKVRALVLEMVAKYLRRERLADKLAGV